MSIQKSDSPAEQKLAQEQNRWDNFHADNDIRPNTVKRNKSLADEYVDILPKDKNGVVLDLGCGTGKDTLELLRNGFRNVISVDVSATALDELCKQLLQLGFAKMQNNETHSQTYTNGEQTCTIIQSMFIEALERIKENKVDTTIASMSLQFADDKDTRKIMQELRRVIKPRGNLIASVFATENVGESVNEKLDANLHSNNDGTVTRYYDENDCKKYFGIIGNYTFTRGQSTLKQNQQVVPVLRGVITNDKQIEINNESEKLL